jgi:hypothetical protein
MRKGSDSRRSGRGMEHSFPTPDKHKIVRGVSHQEIEGNPWTTCGMRDPAVKSIGPGNYFLVDMHNKRSIQERLQGGGRDDFLSTYALVSVTLQESPDPPCTLRRNIIRERSRLHLDFFRSTPERLRVGPRFYHTAHVRYGDMKSRESERLLVDSSQVYSSNMLLWGILLRCGFMRDAERAHCSFVQSNLPYEHRYEVVLPRRWGALLRGDAIPTLFSGRVNGTEAHPDAAFYSRSTSSVPECAHESRTQQTLGRSELKAVCDMSHTLFPLSQGGKDAVAPSYPTPSPVLYTT